MENPRLKRVENGRPPEFCIESNEVNSIQSIQLPEHLYFKFHEVAFYCRLSRDVKREHQSTQFLRTCSSKILAFFNFNLNGYLTRTDLH